MHAPITVNYVPDGEDWTVTVTDERQTESATASGLIAARDQADQIVEKMVPSQISRTVVHLLEGDAVAFTNTYLQARLGLTAPATSPTTISAPAAPAPGSGSGSTPAPAPASIPTPGSTPGSGSGSASIPAPAEAATVPAAPAPTAEPSPQQTPTPTPSAGPPAAGTPAPTDPEQPTSPDKEPELVNVPAQGAEQVS
ncbi:MAG TPA: hypothetical protein VGJ45_12735 [Pseudonocardiaceae bacterium]|jgi:hypothetical protein